MGMMGMKEVMKRLLTKGALPNPSTPSMMGLDRGLVRAQEDVVADFRDTAQYRFLSRYAKDMALDLAMYNAKNMATVPLRLFTSDPRAAKRAGCRVKRIERVTAKHLWNRRDVGAKSVQRADSTGDVHEVTDHPMLDLLTSPDPSTTALAWNVLRFVNKQLFGDALLLVITGSERPIAGLPQLQPQWSDVQPDKDGRIAGWYYGRDLQDRQQYEQDQVFQMKWADSPHNVYRGLGWLELATRELEVEDQALAAELTRWRNGGYPEGVLAFKNVKNAKQLDQAVEEFHKQLRRSRRKGGVIATSESNYTPLSVAQEMNYIPGLELIERRLLNRAGIPTTLYFMNDANLAGSLSAESAYATNTLQPALIIDAEQWTEWLIPRFGGDTSSLWFAYDAVGEENQEAIIAQITGTVPVGVATPNEGRALLGLPPSKDPLADTLLFAGVSLDSLAKQAEAAAVPVFGFGQPAAIGSDVVAGGEAEPLPEDAALNGAQIKELVNMATQVADGSLPKESAIAMAFAAFPSVNQEDILAIFEPITEGSADTEESGTSKLAAMKSTRLLNGSWCEDDPYHCDHAHDEPETKDAASQIPKALLAEFRAIMDAYFGQAGDAAKLSAASGQAVSLESLDAGLKEALEPTMAEIMRLGAIDALAKIGQEDADFFDLEPEAALQAVRERSSLITEQIRGTTEDGIRRVIETGLEQGLTSRETADLVSAAVTDASPARAEAIARTETANAYGQGHQTAWTAAGVKGKRWLLAPNACTLCRALVKAQGPQKGRESKAIPMDKAFWPAGKMVVGSDGKKFTPRVPVMFPPLHPNDRCDFVPELEGDI